MQRWGCPVKSKNQDRGESLEKEEKEEERKKKRRRKKQSADAPRLLEQSILFKRLDSIFSQISETKLRPVRGA